MCTRPPWGQNLDKKPLERGGEAQERPKKVLARALGSTLGAIGSSLGARDVPGALPAGRRGAWR